MKVIKSKSISAFGGINFVYEYLNSLNVNNLLNQELPCLGANSKYNWNDLFYSFLSIYFCGGDCIEDIQINLRSHLQNNPFFKIPSSDTILRRFSSLATDLEFCTTPRGAVQHQFNTNDLLYQLNLKLLKSLNVFKAEELIFDYDNTIIFNEKSDSKMTYKRDFGYQPGVCTLNEDYVLYLENRNGNSDAKSFQVQTLKRLFDSVREYTNNKTKHFRADAASYQYDVVELLENEVDFFYIGCRTSYVEKYFTKVEKWTKTADQFGDLEIGSVLIKPFQRQAKAKKRTPKTYRLLVKRRPRKDKQINMITNDAYDYYAVLSNNFKKTDLELKSFYAHRGNMEK